MTKPDQDPTGGREPAVPNEPMDADTCLRVLSLLLDGRQVDAALAASARAFAAEHPEVAEVERDWRFMREALSETPARRARVGFTEGVLAAAAGSEAPLGTLHFARRLALAASLALVSTLAFDLVRPASLHADAGVQRARHAVDHFREGPFDADDILGGLRARLRDAGFAARGPTEADAR